MGWGTMFWLPGVLCPIAFSSGRILQNSHDTSMCYVFSDTQVFFARLLFSVTILVMYFFFWIPGVLCPIAFSSNSLLLLLPYTSPHRQLLCGLLIQVSLQFNQTESGMEKQQAIAYDGTFFRRELQSVWFTHLLTSSSSSSEPSSSSILTGY